MYRKLVVFVVISLIGGNSNAIAQNENSHDKIEYKIISTKNNTWGYDIFIDGKLKVHQLSIPAIQGIEGFKTKTAAQKTAELIITKIKNGEMPPTITLEELKKLNVK